MVLDSVACDCEDRLVALQLESDITAVELAALHHDLAVVPLRWFAAFTMKEHWHSSDAVFHYLLWLIQIWYSEADPVPR